jgi:glyoxylase I family protein
MQLELCGVAPLLQVFDMPASVKFYCEVLGFELAMNSPVVKSPRQGEYFHFALLRRGDITIMLNTAYDEGERPQKPDPARIAAHGDTALYFGCPDVDAAYEKFRSAGANIQEKPTITQYGMKRCTILDPDGYALSFQWGVEQAQGA